MDEWRHSAWKARRHSSFDVVYLARRQPPCENSPAVARHGFGQVVVFVKGPVFLSGNDTAMDGEMNDLFATSIMPEKVLSSRFRVHPVIGDGMEPALRGNRDYVLTAPVSTYHGEGIYLVDFGLGLELFHVTNVLGKELRLSRENPIYSDHVIDREAFEERVLGKVVADIRTRDERFLRES